MKPAASWCLFIPEKHKAAHYHMNQTSAEMTVCWRKCPVAQPAVLLKDKFIPELEFSHYLVTVTSAESQVEFHKPTQHFWSFAAKQRCSITHKHTKWLHLVWRNPSLWKQLKQQISTTDRLKLFWSLKVLAPESLRAQNDENTLFTPFLHCCCWAKRVSLAWSGCLSLTGCQGCK